MCLRTSRFRPFDTLLGGSRMKGYLVRGEMLLCESGLVRFPMLSLYFLSSLCAVSSITRLLKRGRVLTRGLSLEKMLTIRLSS